MFQERYNRIVLPFLFLLDIFLVLGIFILTHMLIGSLSGQLIYVLFVGIFWAISSLYFKSYHVPRTNSYKVALQPIFFTWCIFSVLYLFSTSFILFPIRLNLFHGIFLLGVGFTLHLISFARFSFFHNYRLKGKNIRNVLLIGLALKNHQLNNYKRECLHFGYHISSNIKDVNDIRKKLKDIISQNTIDYIFLRDMDENVSREVASFCDENGIRLKLLLNIDSITGKNSGLDIIGGFPVMDVRKEPLLNLENRIIKRLIDIVMASLSIILVLTWLPLIVKLAQMISYPGPLFFVQKRIGWNRKTFNLYKFRTMVHSNESALAKMGESEKTSQGDARIPWFGQLLRKTNLDEYPQFINVLLGSMSTVGPRPYMLREDNELANKVIKYRVRGFVKPGITGYAAVNGYRGGTNDLDLMAKRTELDIWYLENWSFWLDMKVMLITIWQMVSFRIPKAY